MLISLILSGSLTARGQTVLLQAPTSSHRAYQARLAAGPDFIAPSESLRRHRPAAPSRDRLLQRYAEAQTAYLRDTPESARRAFAGVLRLAALDDWSDAERQILLSASLRMAQLDPAGAESALRQALTMGPDLNPDATLFPPPLLDRLERLRDELSQLRPELFIGDWNLILINGAECRRNQCSRWHDVENPVRVTFLSDKWLPQTHVVPLRELPRLLPLKTPWVQGDCAHPVVHAGAAELGGKVRPFWTEECAAGQSLAELDLRPAEGGGPTLPFPTPARPAPAPAFYRSPWLWAGLAAVAGVILVQSQKRTQEERRPTTTYGD